MRQVINRKKGCFDGLWLEMKSSYDFVLLRAIHSLIILQSYMTEMQTIPSKSMKETLHRVVGALYSETSPAQLIVRGSGILISPDLVLTAARNVFSHGTKDYYPALRFYPGQSGPLNQYHSVQNYFIPPEYLHSYSVKNAYALLKLKTKVQAQEFIALDDQVWNNEDNQMKIGLYGYPADRYRMSEDSDNPVQQMGLVKKGGILEVSTRRGQIWHSLPTQIGMAGAALLKVNSNKSLSIVGTHEGKKTYKTKQITNCATLLTTKAIQVLRQAGNKLGGMPFKSNQPVESID